MSDLAVIALLGLAIFKLVDVVEGLVPAVARFHTMATLTIAIVATVALDLTVLDADAIGTGAEWAAPVIAGLVLTGMSSVWRGILHWLGTEEGDAPELRHSGRHLRSAA